VQRPIEPYYEGVRVRQLVALSALAVALAALGSACGGDTSTSANAASAPAKPTCPAAWKAGWQRLADRVKAPVYCPAWMPSPLSGQITGLVNYGGGGGYTISVSPDHSYLVSQIWFEPGSGEVHVNLRGYPGRTAIPRCPDPGAVPGTKSAHRMLPCFSEPDGLVREQGIAATLYTVNQGADQWHVLLAWHHDGSLYSVSQHVAEPLTYAKVIASLHRILRNLVLVSPSR
jgi:hypothetical protein